ncbi:hypothetical protein J5N97_008208 [Dioscorea zingiberensis]|uniref:Glutamine amidotransferase domain-containing protein n=1 Tax=Dioscorea zingiberensis TaxID=325984 RepID=A0A9D5HWR7_9LILI|nr:hypothetical protein J5N97_008208 [Dioscorea zingiberensis]
MKSFEEKRFALFLAAKDSDYVKKLYGGYFNVFVEAFGDDGERWDLYRVVEGEFPSLEELEKYDGFVISGSPHNAYGDELWVQQLCCLLQNLIVMRKKVLGICFGHQVLCRALGGRVGKACGGWDIGVRKVVFSKSLHHGIQDIPSIAPIIECHQDVVWEVPIGAEVIAFSEKTRVEMFSFGSYAMGIQGHPEYSKDILNNLIERLVNNESIDRAYADAVKAKLMESEPDTKFWKMLCKGFLKGRNSARDYLE